MIKFVEVFQLKSEHWREHWDLAAKSNIDIRFTSGWGDRTFQEMLFAITDVAEKLELNCEDAILDVGCGAGLFEIAYTHWVKTFHGVDYSKEMVSTAKKNTEMYGNVIIEYADIRNLPFNEELFDKILVNSIIQYLNDFSEVGAAFEELKRVAKKGCRILISLIPDLDKKNSFLNGYYNLGLSKEEIESKIEITENIIWFDKNELKDIAEKCGFKIINVSTPIDTFQKKYYFDMLIEK